MLLETSEDKLLAREVAFEDVQFGSLVRNCVFKENLRIDFTLCIAKIVLDAVFTSK